MNLRILLPLLVLLGIAYLLFWGFAHAPTPATVSSESITSRNAFAPQHARIEMAPPADPSSGQPQY